jgi:transcription antitermination protein NusB
VGTKVDNKVDNTVANKLPTGEPKVAAKPKSARRRSREMAMQGVYQWLLSAEDIGAIEAHLMQAPGFDKSDKEHFSTLLASTIRKSDALNEFIAPCLDRPLHELSPVERAILLVATFELAHHLEIPYRVVINEAVELAKTFGGNEGYKYVNGVLDKVAAKVRAAEVGSRERV